MAKRTNRGDNRTLLGCLVLGTAVRGHQRYNRAECMHRAKVDVSNASINEKGQKLHLIIFQDQPRLDILGQFRIILLEPL